MKGNDIIDSRDVIERIEELEEELTLLEDDLESLEDDLEEYEKVLANAESEDDQDAIESVENDIGNVKDAIESARDAIEDFKEDEYDELIQLARDGENYSGDWKYGATLIRDSYFREYAEDLARDCCDMKSASEWPFCCIDWNLASEQLKQDYTEINFGDDVYWVR
jgi:DNA repair exonuclease SbcCD ATPase subunit